MKRTILMIALVIAGGALWIFSQTPPAQQRTLVLRGGLLIDGTGGAPLSNPVVVISGGKIQSVGQEGSVSVPANATLIDTSGKTILPGLVDSHIHLRNYYAPSYLYWGVTSIGDLGNARGWVLAYRDGVAKGHIVGPYIMAAGTKFVEPPKPGEPLGSGDMVGFSTFLSGNTQMSYVTDQASADREILMAKKAGVDGIKLFDRLNPELMKITAAAAHRQGLPVFSHYSNSLSIEDIVDTGIDTQAHMNGLLTATVPKDARERFARGGGGPPPWHLMDTSKFPALVQTMIDKKIILQATLKRDFERGSKRYDEFVRLNTAYVNNPVLAKLPEFVRARYENGYKTAAAEAANPRRREQMDQLAEGLRKVNMFVKEYADRGGKVIAASDLGSGTGAPGLTLHAELQMLADTGMKPMKVIQAATSYAMEAWGKSKEAGTVQAGKRADLLVLNRNPLDDMSATMDIYRVIQGGSVIDREGLANWQEALPRPMPVQQPGFPTLLHYPFIIEVDPEVIVANSKNAPEVAISGQNFAKEDLVLINDRLVAAKTQNDHELRVSVPPEIQKKPGIYSLAVVQPGSAGGISNPVYLIVEPN